MDRNSSLKGISCFIQKPKKRTIGITKTSIRIKINLRTFGLIFPILLKMISFEKYFKEINSLPLNYNSRYFQINSFAKFLSKYMKNKISTNDITIKIFEMF